MTKNFFLGNNSGMREIIQDIDRTIRQVKDITGIKIKLKVNRGRNKIELMEGAVENVYPKIFTFRKTDGELSSFSYSDILSKNIKFFKVNG